MTPRFSLVPVGAIILNFLLSAGRLPAEPGDREEVVAALARRIDHHIEAGWKEHGVKPATPIDDGAFLRRAYLDLAGKVPPLTTTRDYLDDPIPDRRRRLVRRLLQTDDYARHTTALWGRQLFPPSQNGAPGPTDDNPAMLWLRRQIKGGAGQDRIVRALLAPPQPRGGAESSAAQQFLNSNGNRADSMAAATSRLFLGVRLECAQCHDHPFAAWNREQFWQLAAFFSALPSTESERRPARPGREIVIPNTNRVVPARFLDGAAPRFKDGDEGRNVLAEWITRRDNPYFAQAAVNRLWARYFGTGLVDPFDDVRAENPPSHPGLLDELARAFVDSGFDERFLTEAILSSKVYPLSSVETNPAQREPQRFARAALRGLTAEQVFDSLAEVTGIAVPAGRRNEALEAARAQFLTRFATPERATESQTSMLQALYLMNGPLIARATSPEGNRFLRVLGESAAEHPERCVEELYLTVLIRPPTPAERARMVRYIREGGPEKNPARAVADVFWVLLNSTEFVVNH